MKIKLLLAAVVILALGLRLYRVESNPPGLYSDELAIGYNAYSILKTGRDEWNQPLPILFRSYNDYKLPLYIYTTSLSIAIFGLTPLAVRFPAILSGALSVLIVYFLTSELILLVKSRTGLSYLSRQRPKISLLVALLLATSSWHLQFTRAGFEASLALFFSLAGFWLFFLAIRRNIRLEVPSLIFVGAAMYTYHNARIVFLLFLPFLFLLFRKQLFNTWRTSLFAVAIFLLAMLPLIRLSFTPEGNARLIAESVLQGKGSVLTNFSNNYIANFSFDYLFFHGDQSGRHSVKKLGELFLWQLPFVLLGIYSLIKNKSHPVAIILLAWLLLGPLPAAITRVSPHALRSFLIVPVWQIIIAIGIVRLSRRWHLLPSVILGAILAYSFALYLHLYYIHYPRAYAKDWSDGDKEAVLYLNSVAPHYNRIYIDRGFSYSALVFYLQLDPGLWQQSHREIQAVSPYQFIDTAVSPYPPKLSPDEHNLVLVPARRLADSARITKEIRMINGDPVYRIYDY